ncbi:alcohol dehydrogenase catalytic domain-containing protein, partial [Streptomyces sp. SID625]|nr:alcohol dehydrogenase catalytic domain-containing protein [Streptomyces sp. SID625]
MAKAYVFTRYGGPETEALVDIDRPRPGPGQILVAVRAAGVNPVDWKLRDGFRRPGDTGEPVFPIVFGSEASGVVEEVGEGVTGFAPGDEVFGNAAGGYAQYTLLSAAVTAHKPAGLSFTDAATLPVAAATAYDGLRQLA